MSSSSTFSTTTPSKILSFLTCLTLLGSALAAYVGLFSTQPVLAETEFSTVYSETIRLYGSGLYHYDWDFRAAIFKGTDAVTLFVIVPLGLLTLLWYQRRPFIAGLVLTGLLAMLFYNAASLAFGVHYNKLFLLYLSYFSLSFFAFFLSMQRAYAQLVSLRRTPEGMLEIVLPHKRLIIGFLLFSSLSPLVWLVEHIQVALSQGIPESVAHYTTEITTVLDAGLIFPTIVLAAYWLWRSKAQGYLLTTMLLTLLVCIGLVVVGQSVMQWREGMRLTGYQAVLFVSPFILLSALGCVALRAVLQAIHRATLSSESMV